MIDVVSVVTTTTTTTTSTTITTTITTTPTTPALHYSSSLTDSTIVTLSDVATWKKKDYDIGVNWARDLQIDLEEDLKALRNNRVDDPALIAMEKAYQEQPTKFTSHPYNMPEPSVNNKKKCMCKQQHCCLLQRVFLWTAVFSFILILILLLVLSLFVKF